MIVTRTRKYRKQVSEAEHKRLAEEEREAFCRKMRLRERIVLTVAPLASNLFGSPLSEANALNWSSPSKKVAQA